MNKSFYYTIILLMNKDNVKQKLKIDKYQPMLRQSKNIKFTQSQYSSLQKTKSIQKFELKKKVSSVFEKKTLPSLNISKCNDSLHFLKRELSLQKNQERHSNQRCSQQYIIGDLFYIKDKIRLTPILIQQQDLLLIPIKKLQQLFQTDEIQQILIKNRQPQKSIAIDTNKQKTLIKENEFKVNHQKITQIKVSKIFEIKISNSNIIKNSNKNQDNTPLQDSYNNSQLNQRLKDTFKEQSEETQHIYNKTGAIISQEKIQQTKKNQKQILNLQKNVKKAKIISLNENNHKRIAGKNIDIKKKKIEIQIQKNQQEQNLQNKDKNGTYNLLADHNIIEQRYFSSSFNQQIKNNKKSLERPKQFEKQMIDFTMLSQNGLKRKIQSEIPLKFKEIKECQLDLLMKANCDQFLMANSDLLSQHFKYIIQQSYSNYLQTVNLVQYSLKVLNNKYHELRKIRQNGQSTLNIEEYFIKKIIKNLHIQPIQFVPNYQKCREIAIINPSIDKNSDTKDLKFYTYAKDLRIIIKLTQI